MKNLLFRFRFAVVGLAVLVAPTQLIQAATNDQSNGAETCQHDFRSPLYEKFLSENDIGSKFVHPALRERFRIQGLIAWNSLNEETAKLGFRVLPPNSRLNVDVQSPHSRQIFSGPYNQQQYEDVRQKILAIPANVPSTHPVTIMSEYVKSLNALRAHNFILARQLAHAALIRSRSVNGPGNAAEILGHYVSAQASYQQGEMAAALNSIENGLSVINTHSNRAAPLGGYQVALLLTKAEILERDLEVNVVPPPGQSLDSVAQEIESLRNKARKIIKASRTTFGSPYFDAASIVPMLQAASTESWSIFKTILGTPSQVSERITILAAITPSGSRGSSKEVRFAKGSELLGAIQSCMEAQTFAGDAGDFDRKRQVRQTVLNLLNPRNAEVLLRDIRRDSDDDGQVSVSDFTNLQRYIGKFLSLGQDSFIEGEGVLFYRHLDNFLKPRLIDSAIEAAIWQEETEWDDDEIRKRLRKAKPAARAAARFGLDILGTLAGDQNNPRARRLRSAMELLTGSRVDSIASSMYALAENDDADEDEIAEDRLLYRLAGLGAGSLAWMNANATGDERLANSIQSELVNSAKRIAMELRPGAPAATFTAIENLGKRNSKDQQLFVDTATVMAFAAETAGIDEDDLGDPNEKLANDPYSDQTEAREKGQMAAGLLLMPPAQVAEEYDQVLKIGKPAIQAFETLRDDATSTGEAMYTSLGGTALAAYADALLKTGELQRAASFVNRIQPTEGFFLEDYWSESSREIGRLAASDELLDIGVRANLAIENYDQAFAYSVARVSRANSFVETQKLVSDRSFRKVIQSPRAPFEQLIALAASTPEEAEIPWNHVLFAFSAIRKSEAAEAQIIRNLAHQAGATARQAYEDFVLAQSDFQDASAAASLGFNALTKGSDLDDYADEHWEKAEKFYESRARLLANLPPEIAQRIEGGLTLSELQASLRQNEVVLAHAVSEGRVAILAVSKQGRPSIFWSPLSIAEIRNKIDTTEADFRLPSEYLNRSQIAAPDLKNLTILYDALIQPAQDIIRRANHVIWSPDSEIAAVPILALRSEGKFTSPDGRKTDYFGLGMAVSFAPRIDSFSLARNVQRQSATGSLAVGDVTYQQTKAPAHNNLLGRPTSAIPPTRMARTTIQEFVEATGGKSITGNMARPEILAKLPRQHLNMLMFFVHGSDAQRLRPAALLLQGKSPSEISEYTPAEVLRSPVSADFVMLAACNTGAGHTETGSPYSGLVMSYLAKGSVAVLTAQQQVDEEATSQIVVGLARDLQKGSKIYPAEALRNEIFKLSKESKFENPIFWSQFLWVGDGAR